MPPRGDIPFLTLSGATTVQASQAAADTEKLAGGATTDGPVWLSPIIDSSKGVWRTRSGRMGLDKGEGNEKYGTEPY
jgi:hypothetical protein